MEKGAKKEGRLACIAGIIGEGDGGTRNSEENEDLDWYMAKIFMEYCLKVDKYINPRHAPGHISIKRVTQLKGVAINLNGWNPGGESRCST